MNKKVKIGVSVALWIVIIFLTIGIYGGVMGPINFKNERNKRFEVIKAHLGKIRDVQLAFKSIKGKHAKTFDELEQLVANDDYILTQSRDSVVTYYDKIYRIDRQKEITIVDTLGRVAVIDSLFKDGKYDPDKLRFVPFTNEQNEFQMAASDLKKNGVKIPVFEVKVKKEIVLNGLPKQYIRQEEDAIDVKGKYLVLGSLTQPTINGNW